MDLNFEKTKVSLKIDRIFVRSMGPPIDLFANSKNNAVAMFSLTS